LNRSRLTTVSSAVISASCSSLKCSLKRANSSWVTSTGIRIAPTGREPARTRFGAGDCLEIGHSWSSSGKPSARPTRAVDKPEEVGGLVPARSARWPRRKSRNAQSEQQESRGRGDGGPNQTTSNLSVELRELLWSGDRFSPLRTRRTGGSRLSRPPLTWTPL
jgi:hypothetical protein